jgi:hypothetical protein
VQHVLNLFDVTLSELDVTIEGEEYSPTMREQILARLVVGDRVIYLLILVAEHEFNQATVISEPVAFFLQFLFAFIELSSRIFHDLLLQLFVDLWLEGLVEEHTAHRAGIVAGGEEFFLALEAEEVPARCLDRLGT